MASGIHPPDHRPGMRFRLAALVGLATIGLGAIGHWRYERTAHPDAVPDLLSVFYHASQLLILHGPHLDHAVPWPLHLARVLGGCLFFWAGVAAFLEVFRDEVLLLRLWMRRREGHVVICGLGDLGLRLALDGRRRGRFVVAIESRGVPAALEQARDAGVLVLDGNACEPAVLQRARVERAEFLVAACPSDATNVAIAASVGTLLARHPPRSKPVTCRLLIADPRTREALAHESLFPNTGPGYRIDFHDLDHLDTAVRQAIERHPLDFERIGEHDTTVVHVVVVGFGPVGQSLALHTARIAHFANEVGRGILPRLSVVDRDPRPAWSDFCSRHPSLAETCVPAFHARDPRDPELVRELVERGFPDGGGDTLVTYAVCLEHDEAANLLENDEAANLRIGLALSQATKDRRAQTLVFQSSRCGFAALLSPEGHGTALSPRLHAFGMLEDVFTWDALLHESEDQLARALHEAYQRHQARALTPSRDNPSWDQLSDAMRDSNRQAADHVAIKLRALGCEIRPLRPGGRGIASFSEQETLLLARMEHLRWCAERRLDGWTYGPTTERSRKINCNLRPWDDLPRAEQEKDPVQIRAIPDALRASGRGIFPRRPTAPAEAPHGPPAAGSPRSPS